MTWDVALIASSALLALLQTFAEAVAKRFQEPAGWGVGSRDGPRQAYSGVVARLDRASANMLETFPIFATLAICSHLSVHDEGELVAGCGVSLAARVAYVPIYAAGVGYVRTGVYMVSLIGISVTGLSML